jgi:molybdopterin-guanine dinucleotide biosynthesis protein A
MKRHDHIAAFILAGGASSRMGKPKALLELGEIPLIIRTVRLLEPLVHEVSVVGSPELYADFGLRTIRDQNPAGQQIIGEGPLVGIASALRTTEVPWNLMLACDLPYLTVEWIDWLLSRATESSAQVVVPLTLRGIEPLAAVYHRESLGAIDTALAHGVRKVSDALIEVKVDLVRFSEWQSVDRTGRVLMNMNTCEDYEEAKRWHGAKGVHA